MIIKFINNLISDIIFNVCKTLGRNYFIRLKDVIVLEYVGTDGKIHRLAKIQGLYPNIMKGMNNKRVEGYFIRIIHGVVYVGYAKSKEIMSGMSGLYYDVSCKYYEKLSKSAYNNILNQYMKILNSNV